MRSHFQLFEALIFNPIHNFFIRILTFFLFSCGEIFLFTKAGYRPYNYYLICARAAKFCRCDNYLNMSIRCHIKVL